MMKYVLAGLAATLIMIGVGYYQRQQPDLTSNRASSPSLPALTAARPPAAQTSTHPASTTLAGESLAINSSAESTAPVPVAEPDDQPQTISAWSEPAEPAQIPSRFTARGITASQVELNREAISALRRGDRLQLPVPQSGKDYAAIVDQVSKNNLGGRRISAYLSDEDMPYSVVITNGPASTYVTMSTPDGTFMLETVGTQSWITSQSEMEHLIDPNIRDYIIPESGR